MWICLFCPFNTNPILPSSLHFLALFLLLDGVTLPLWCPNSECLYPGTSSLNQSEGWHLAGFWEFHEEFHSACCQGGRGRVYWVESRSLDHTLCAKCACASIRRTASEWGLCGSLWVLEVALSTMTGLWVSSWLHSQYGSSHLNQSYWQSWIWKVCSLCLWNRGRPLSSQRRVIVSFSSLNCSLSMPIAIRLITYFQMGVVIEVMGEFWWHSV